MFFEIDPNDDVPIYEQLIRQVKLAIADGTLGGGQMLPSVRQLSKDLTLNPNTIARAYRDLQTQQVIEPLRGRGMVIRRDAVADCTDARNALVSDALRSAMTDAVSGGMSHSELRDVFERLLAELPSSAESNGQTHSSRSQEKADG
ncbi:MAG: GntR family transcriptional regulator [Planctomycetota bacterium]